MALADKAYQQIDIISPIDGLVTLRNVEPGQKVTNSTTLFEISDKLVVEILVDETDISKVRLGMKAKITLDAYSDRIFYGKVIKIAYSSTVESNVTSYKVLVEFSSALSRSIKSGMSADVELIVKEKKNVLKVPLNAVRKKNGTAYVLLYTGSGRVKQWEVSVGDSDDSGIEIVSGLEAGDEIALPLVKSSSKDSDSKDKNMDMGMGGPMGMGMGGGMPPGGGGGSGRSGGKR